MKFTFTDKASYLAWRAEWKANYAQLTTDIRTQKRSRKQFLRSYDHYTSNQGFPVRRLLAKTANPAYGGYSSWQLGGLRREAATQMEILAEAKALSWTLKQQTAQSGSTPAENSHEATPATEPTPASLTTRAFSALRSALSV